MIFSINHAEFMATFEDLWAFINVNNAAAIVITLICGWLTWLVVKGLFEQELS